MASGKSNVFEYLVKVGRATHGTVRLTTRQLNKAVSVNDAIARVIGVSDPSTIRAKCIGEAYWPRVK